MKNRIRIRFHIPRIRYAYKSSYDIWIRNGIIIDLNTYFSIQTYKSSINRFGFIVISILGFGFQLDYGI